MPLRAFINCSGEGGIRTRGKLLTYTRFPSVLLKPLGHLSINEPANEKKKKGKSKFQSSKQSKYEIIKKRDLNKVPFKLV